MTKRIKIKYSILLVVHVFLVALFFFFRSAGRYHLAIEVNPHEISVVFDGTEAVKIEAPPWREGHIGLELITLGESNWWAEKTGVFQEWDYIRVFDGKTDELLFEDNFSNGILQDWKTVQGSPQIRWGAVTADDLAVIETVRNFGTNYRIEADILGGWSAGMRLLATDDENYVHLEFRPFLHRNINLSIVEKGNTVGMQKAKTIPAPFSRMAVFLTKILLIYGCAVLLAVVISFIFCALLLLCIRLKKIISFCLRLKKAVNKTKAAVIIPFGAAIAAVIISSYINLFILEGRSHVQDSGAYIFQAKIFAAGRLWAPVPECPQFFIHTFLTAKKDKMFTHYPYGYPMLLAPGIKLGLGWLVNPVLGGLSLLLLSRLGLILYNRETANIAVLLGLVSPFFLLMHGTFMSHGAGLFYTLAFLYCLFSGDKRHKFLRGFGAGVFLGMLAATRPLTSFAGGLLMFVFTIWDAVQSRLKNRDHMLGMLTGLILSGFVFLGYNALLTGDPLLTTYEAYAGRTMVANTLSFGAQKKFKILYRIAKSFHNIDNQFSSMMAFLFRWPVFLVLAPLFIPALKPAGSASDRFMASGFIFIIGAYFLFYSDGLCYGPRYYFEALPFILLLTARGLILPMNAAGRLTERVKSAAGKSISHAATPLRWTLLSLILIFSVRNPAGYGSIIKDMRDQNIVSGEILKTAKKKKIDDAVVFVVPKVLEDNWREFGAQIDHRIVRRITYAGHTRPDEKILDAHWMDYGSVWPQNTPDFDGPIVYAHYLGFYLDTMLMDMYPGRDFYLGFYPSGRLIPYEFPKYLTPAKREKADEFEKESPSRIVWLSAPAKSAGETTFFFNGAMDDKTGKINLYVNNEYALTVEPSPARKQQWKSDDYELRFAQKKMIRKPKAAGVARAGLFRLTVPAARICKGQPVGIAAVPVRNDAQGPFFAVYDDPYALRNEKWKNTLDTGRNDRMNFNEGFSHTIYALGMKKGLLPGVYTRQRISVWFYDE